MKSVKMFGKSVPLLTIVMISVLVVGASAGILAYYGRITSTVNVLQSVLLNGASDPASDITETVNGIAGDTIKGITYILTNQAEKKIVVKLQPGTLVSGITRVYPEYKLDATVDDDAIFVPLVSTLTWPSFTGISFEYLMESDGGNKWIPQINLALRDGEGTVKYFASWHSFRTGITGVVGSRESITYDKADFYLYRTDWSLLGLWSDTRWIEDSYTSLTVLLSVAQTDLLKDEIDLLMFKYFVQNAGDTAIDDNPAVAQQVVFVSNHATQVAVTGIIIPPLGTYPSFLADMAFRMAYEFDPAATAGDYTVVTTIDPIGFP